MFLAGVSTRTLSMMSERLIGRRISAMEVSEASKELTRASETWRERDLSDETYKYIFVDGTFFTMRIDGDIDKVPVLVAIGVTEAGHRTVLGLQFGDKESASNWRELFKDRKRRGLNAKRVTLGIMDGLKCLEYSLDACLTYLSLPQEEWICLRTTNVIERVNKNSNGERNRWRSLQEKDLAIPSWPLSV